jgi:O-antigen/teichoic acid export membrane protein
LSGAGQRRSLATRTIKGAGWLMGWRVASRLLGVVNTVVLVRLLTPSDFGLVALALSFSLAIDGVSYLGVPEALVREPTLDRAMYDTGFTMGALRGLMTTLVIAAAAWPAARFFGDPRLVFIFLALALGLFATTVENIGTVDFQRDMTFGKQFQLQIVPRIASIVVTLACAVVWRSYWALIAGMLTNRGLRTVLTYVIHPYRPRLTLRAWRRLIGFSFWSWALSMVALLQARADTIILGGYLTPTAVGVYSVGGEIGGLASSELMGPMSGALFAGFAAARRSGDGLAWAYLRAISLVVLLTLPASAGMAVLAGPMMHLMFGPRWDAAVPVAQMFAFIGMFQVGGLVSEALLTVQGQLSLNFRINLAFSILKIIVLLVLVPTFGLMGAASGVAAIGLLQDTVYLVVTFRHAGLRLRDLALNLWRSVLAASVMAAVLLGTGLHIEPLGDGGVIWSGLHLAMAVLIGALVYGATLGLAWLAAGRPRGAESYVLELAGQAIRHWLGR